MVDLVTAVQLVLEVAVFGGGAALGILLAPRTVGTRLWFPVTVLFTGIAIAGGLSALGRLALIGGDTVLLEQLERAKWIGIGLSMPALVNFVAAYPRVLRGALVRRGVPAFYFLGIAFAALAPTRLMFEAVGDPQAGIAPTYGPAYWPLQGALAAGLAVTAGWTAYLSFRGRTPSERLAGRALTLTVVVPLGLYGVLLGTAGTSAGGGAALDLYFLSFLASIAFVLFNRTIEPPIASTFRSLLDSVDEAVVVVDHRGRVSSANPAARSLLGIPKGESEGEEVLALLQRSVESAEAAAFVDRTVKGVQRGRLESHEGLLEGVGAGRLTCRWRVYPLGKRDGAGEPAGALLMLRDETARRALEKSTEKSRDVLDLVIRMLGHDLKAPLTVLQGYIDLDRLRLESPPDAAAVAKIRADLDKMAEAVVGMHMMMGDARSLSRLAVSPERADLAEVDLTRLVGQAADLLRPISTARSLRVERQLEEGVRVHVAPGFDSVPRNLLDNAIKYTPPGGAVLVTLAAAGDSVRLKVADTGPGIPPEKLDQLFRKFERLGAEIGPAEGHGLGLSIVAKLVELSGGSIKVADREDGKPGAVFIVDLPNKKR